MVLKVAASIECGQVQGDHISSKDPAHGYSFNGTPLTVVVEERDQGVIIDSELKFHSQTAASVSKASQMLAVIKRSFANIDTLTKYSARPSSAPSGSLKTMSGDHSAQETKSGWSGLKAEPRIW